MKRNHLTKAIRSALMSVREPERAAAMKAYMKSEMPYLGVRYDPLRSALAPIFSRLEYANAEDWRTDVSTIWHAADFREERYAAIELCSAAAARPFQRCGDSLDLYEELIVDGAWWDYVDPVAGGFFWTLLHDDRQTMTRAMRKWSRSADIWKRRSAIICQLRAKHETDLDLLYFAIEGSIDSREFFLRKAIGWALRQHARTDPDEVVRYVEENADRLSPLSRREAIKRIPSK